MGIHKVLAILLPISSGFVLAALFVTRAIRKLSNYPH